MLLTLPRAGDVLGGVVFIAVNAAVYVLSYYAIIHRPSDPATQHIAFIFILYGSIQSLIGFVGGLCLARITGTEEKITTLIDADEEEMLLITDSLPILN